MDRSFGNVEYYSILKNRLGFNCFFLRIMTPLGHKIGEEEVLAQRLRELQETPLRAFRRT
jgi:hypothetical protein